MNKKFVYQVGNNKKVKTVCLFGVEDMIGHDIKHFISLTYSF